MNNPTAGKPKWVVREVVHETDYGPVVVYSVMHTGHYRPLLAITGNAAYDRARFAALVGAVNAWEADHD